jgi:uncharacterized protein
MDRFVKIWAISFLLFFVSFCCIGNSFAQEFPAIQNPPKIVNDFAGILKQNEINALEQKLVAFSDSTSTQIAIVIVKSLNDYDVADYAFKLGEKWGIGQKGKDNGLLLLIAPNERKTYIATGYGVEEYIPDAIAKRIIENQLKPYFRNGDYNGGINAAVDEIIARVTGKFVAEPTPARGKKGSFFTLILIVVGIIILMKIFGGGNNGGGRRTFGSAGPIFWGGMGGFGGGGFGGGGSSGGGGFGGFGGGSFGGGGAGGSW